MHKALSSNSSTAKKKKKNPHGITSGAFLWAFYTKYNFVVGKMWSVAVTPVVLLLAM
jgi:hypothetical protein